ncbi:MAG: TatD family hydrolase [Candidatus Colwellbacteria bacterium]|nr:TatD family hydrolase [Candidatus Colwellbacteria bacterium]
MPKLFDAHTHVQFAAYENDMEAVISRSLQNGVWLANVGTQKDTSAKALEVANKYEEGVYATVGLHPIHTEKSYHDVKELGDGVAAKEFTSRGEEFDYNYYLNLGKNPKVLAIGECGLDYYRLNDTTKERQRTIFLEQVRLAKELDKPLMIHCRQAFGDLIDMLKYNRGILRDMPGVVHFFSGSMEETRELLELNFSFTFGGVITFTRDYEEIIKYIPLSRILLETDAPYVAPTPYRGQRNEPVYVKEVAKAMAEIKSKSYDKIAEQTFANSRAIFNI